MKAKQAKITPPIEEMLSEYNNLREQKKLIDSRMKGLSDEIKKYAEANGVKDEKGSFYCDRGGFVFGKQAKKSISFIADKAIIFFKAKGLKDAVRTVEVLDNDAVERYINEGEVTMEELESITNTSVSYAIDIRKKEEVVDEVQESTVSIAASRKPGKPMSMRAKRGN